MKAITTALHAALTTIAPQQTIYIAFSGGLDSSVLLHASHAIALRQQRRLQAIHVDHQMQAAATQMAQHCQHICDQLGVQLHTCQVNIAEYVQLGPEGAAREARYHAFSQYLQENDVLFTAHHAEDQVETVLLRLLRGAGSRGLVGCLGQRTLGMGQLQRPLLAIPRAQLEHYARAHKLSIYHDASNDALEFERNYLRHKVMPAIVARWPHVGASIARSSQWQLETAHLLDRLAQQDLANCTDNPLAIEQLPEDQASLKNALRWWIQRQGLALPGARVLQEIVSQLLPAGDDAMACVRWQDNELRKYRAKVYALQRLTAHDASICLDWDLTHDLNLDALKMRLTRARLEQAGLQLTGIDRLQVRFRQGGESLRPRGRGCEKTLKTLFQEAGVPPWLRSRIPLLYHQQQLIYVFGYWIHEGY